MQEASEDLERERTASVGDRSSEGQSYERGRKGKKNNEQARTERASKGRAQRRGNNPPPLLERLTPEPQKKGRHFSGPPQNCPFLWRNQEAVKRERHIGRNFYGDDDPVLGRFSTRGGGRRAPKGVTS